jgi:hypothetical protein
MKMANVKQVEIVGEMPFDAIHDDNGMRTEAGQKLLETLGQLNMPLSGLRITYMGYGKRVPNKHGGHMTFVKFVIHGEDSVSWSYLEHLVSVFTIAGADISKANATDIEESSRPFNLLKSA